MLEASRRPRFGAAAASFALTAALVLGGGSAALAATPTAAPAATAAPTATPAPAATARTAKPAKPSTPAIHYPSLAELHAAERNVLAKAAEVARIGEQVVALQHQADAAGKASEVADERALRATQAAEQAQGTSDTAAEEAATAAATARESRARASALAANLARTDMGTLPISLMLNDRTDGSTLQGLSTATQLTSETARVFRKAEADEAAAVTAKATAARAAKQAAAAARTATAAAAAAKRTAEASASAVRTAQQHEETLALDLAVLDATKTKTACDYAAGTKHQPLCDATSLMAAAKTPALKAVAFARAQIGDPYVFAAAGPNAWDCSGLTMGAYAAVGIDIGPHSATAQYDLEKAEGHLVPFSQVQPGDLLFYTDGGGDMYHTTIYSGNGLMIEAPYAGADVREVAVRTTDLVPQVARPTL